MFQPSPVKSGSENAIDPVQQRHHSSPSHVLANSPHPVLDGVDRQRQHHITAKTQSMRNSNGSSQIIASKRSFYPSDSEFINATHAGIKEGAAEAESNKRTRHTHSKTEEESDVESIQQQQDDEDNESDDEGQEESNEDNNANAEIPTLDTYVPRQPCYEKANALPFAVICKRLEALWTLRFKEQESIQARKADLPIARLPQGIPRGWIALSIPETDTAGPRFEQASHWPEGGQDCGRVGQGNGAWWE